MARTGRSTNAFTVKYPNCVNRLITTVYISQAFDPSHQPTPSAPRHEITAQWDTGATNSVITRATAEALGLKATGCTMVNHAGGSGWANTHIVNIMLPNHVGHAGVLVTECESLSGGIGALIGMDIIGKGDLAISNNLGQTCMTYRSPSTERIDFVRDIQRATAPQIGRNDPCPCGKKHPDGRPMKYKQCCGR